MTKYKISNDWWTTPTESLNGHRVIVTGRRGLEKAISSGKFNDRIEITWQYVGDAEGMPDYSTSLLMEKVNDALINAFSKEQAAIITGIYTGDSERNWIFYVRNIPKFQQILNDALKEFDVLPLKLYAEKDPNWEEYSEMRELTEIEEGE